MKKNFYIIGILVSVFLIYFMLLLADHMVYLNDDLIYDFMLEKEISYEELRDIAIETDATIQVRNYECVGFGKSDIEIIVFNSKNDSGTVKRNSLFPADNIRMVYNPDKLEKDDKCMLFTVQSQEKLLIEEVNSLLEEKEYVASINVTDIRFHPTHLFSPLNAQFFLLMFVLVLLCIAMYYMSRTKEIGILKMNGWGNKAISAHMLKRMLGYSVVGFLPLSIAFMIYILIMDNSLIGHYLYISILLLLCFMVSYTLAAVVAIFFIKAINCVDAVKEKKNGHLVVIVLTGAKICITVLCCAILSSTFDEIVDIHGSIQDAKQIREFEFYEMYTPVALEEEMVERIDAYLAKLDDTKIYNYDSSDVIYKKSDLEHVSRIEDYETVCESNIISISTNLLTYCKIKKADGSCVSAVEIEDEAILIPKYLEGDEIVIREWLGLDESMQVIYIENDQSYPDMLWPGVYAYNPIVLVHPTVIQVYINSGEILYSKEVVDEVKSYLDESGVGNSSIYIQSRENSIFTVLSGYYTQLFEKGLFSVIMIFAFLLTDFALVISYIQFNKKKIGVMVLHGKRVIMSTWGFLLLLLVIDLIAVTIFNIYFGFLIVFDVLIYQLEMNSMLKSGVTRLINGL